mmetsp:Transcript_3430/g.7486  ORF Transcript_3430/g.7486 Transcript_3430/m.7486 type:complete len:234 (-) Transcript_3430:324-1025(-)
MAATRWPSYVLRTAVCSPSSSASRTWLTTALSSYTARWPPGSTAGCSSSSAPLAPCLTTTSQPPGRDSTHSAQGSLYSSAAGALAVAAAAPDVASAPAAVAAPLLLPAASPPAESPDGPGAAVEVVGAVSELYHQLQSVRSFGAQLITRAWGRDRGARDCLTIWYPRWSSNQARVSFTASRDARSRSENVLVPAGPGCCPCCCWGGGAGCCCCWAGSWLSMRVASTSSALKAT